MMWNWLTFWRGKPEKRLADWRVVLYTRAGCHLCEDAWTRLETARARYGFALTKVDVDSDVALAARYGLEVPVVEVNGKVRFRGQVNALLFQRLLDAHGAEA
jgi:glutaredoxin